MAVESLAGDGHDPGITQSQWEDLAERAWRVRERARVHGKNQGRRRRAFQRKGRCNSGCNVEHIFRSHDVHAEVNALTTMTASGDGPAVAVLIASEREKFTPCGGCLDWIFELGGPETLVAFQGTVGGKITAFRADELMPHYPS